MVIMTNTWKTSSFCSGGGCVELNFVTSSYCTLNDGCVEAARGDEAVLLRDSKDPQSPILSFTRDEWAAFVLGVKAGEFDWAGSEGDDGAPTGSAA